MVKDYNKAMYLNSVTMLKDSVVEFCYIESGVAVQENCILSNLHVPVSSI